MSCANKQNRTAYTACKNRENLDKFFKYANSITDRGYYFI